MTSAKKVAANRRNAKKSTGPRTKGGRARTSRNAQRHGLAALNAANTVALDVIKRIADRLCDEDAEPMQYEQATIIAECQLNLARVRSVRVATIERMRITAGNPSDKSGDQPQPRDQMIDSANKRGAIKFVGEPASRDDLECVRLALPELAALERYERRAISRRKRAIETLSAIRALRKTRVPMKAEDGDR